MSIGNGESLDLDITPLVKGSGREENGYQDQKCV
jgi:hypothetical protein